MSDLLRPSLFNPHKPGLVHQRMPQMYGPLDRAGHDAGAASNNILPDTAQQDVFPVPGKEP